MGRRKGAYSYKHITIVRAIWRSESGNGEPVLWTNPCFRALNHDEQEEAKRILENSLAQTGTAADVEDDDNGAAGGDDDEIQPCRREEEKQDGGVHELGFWEQHSEN